MSNREAGRMSEYERLRNKYYDLLMEVLASDTCIWEWEPASWRHNCYGDIGMGSFPADYISTVYKGIVFKVSTNFPFTKVVLPEGTSLRWDCERRLFHRPSPLALARQKALDRYDAQQAHQKTQEKITHMRKGLKRVNQMGCKARATGRREE